MKTQEGEFVVLGTQNEFVKEKLEGIGLKTPQNTRNDPMEQEASHY